MEGVYVCRSNGERSRWMESGPQWFRGSRNHASGCALDPQGGYRPVTQTSGSPERPIPFDEANARCWAVSMNIAGFAATIPQLEAYKACMARNGWEDRRRLF